MINKKDDSVIADLASRKIDINEFYKRFSIDLSANPYYFRDEWKKALQAKDEETLQNVLFIECWLYDNKYNHWRPDGYYLPDIRKLIKAEWHKQHEELIDILMAFNDKKDQSIYIDVLHTTFDYYKGAEETFMVPIWVKCIWKLAQIGTPEAIKSIKELKNSPYKHIKDTVTKQYQIHGWKE